MSENGKKYVVMLVQVNGGKPTRPNARWWFCEQASPYDATWTDDMAFAKVVDRTQAESVREHFGGKILEVAACGGRG